MTDDGSALTLPEELLLLALDTERGKPLCSRAYLRYGVAGAVLAELELQGRIREERGRVRVVDPLGPAHPLLASLLGTLGAPAKKNRFLSHTSPTVWIRQYGRNTEESHLEHLVARGLLRRETRRFLGVFPYQRHFPGDPDLTGAARWRFGQAEARNFPDRRSRALAGLAAAAGLAETLTAEGREGISVMRILCRSHWIASAVHTNVRQSQSSSSGGDGGGWSDGGSGGCGGGCGGGGD
ncbi:GPP34 family phosphoprotein [Streptomyces sp. DH8]|uniref:GOLPH3/VPS74 family protein n=1 Tax=Streptomyces sp. DH8 TaxID=2857008 RepID=UPI001E34BBE3|nr:GPP34 family phosphoprotein [Streptomyces sp. DH8]